LLVQVHYSLLYPIVFESEEKLLASIQELNETGYTHCRYFYPELIRTGLFKAL
jgi:hypothetical protein